MSIYVSCINWNKEVPNWYENFLSSAQTRMPKVAQTLLLPSTIHKEEGTKHFDDGTELKEIIIEVEEPEEINAHAMPLMKAYEESEKVENKISASSIFQKNLSMCQPYPFMLATLDTDFLIESPKFRFWELFSSCIFCNSSKEQSNWLKKIHKLQQCIAKRIFNSWKKPGSVW